MPYERKEFPYPLKVGADIRSVQNLQVLSDDLFHGIDFCMIDCCNALNFRDEKTIASRDIALSRPGKSKYVVFTKDPCRYLCVFWLVDQ